MTSAIEALAVAVRRDLAANASEPDAHDRHPHDGHPHDHADADDGVVARVGDRIVSVAQLHARLDAIYRGPMGMRLPTLASPEGQRIRRWAAQLLVSEALVLAEAERAGIAVRLCPPLVPTDALTTPNGADEATEAAVMAAARELFEVVTAGITVDEVELRRFYDANLDLWDHSDATGPVPFADVRDDIADELLAAARGAAFDDWLTRRRAQTVTLAPGYEHPGDPSAPDFVHRH